MASYRDPLDSGIGEEETDNTKTFIIQGNTNKLKQRFENTRLPADNEDAGSKIIRHSTQEKFVRAYFEQNKPKQAAQKQEEAAGSKYISGSTADKCVEQLRKQQSNPDPGTSEPDGSNSTRNRGHESTNKQEGVRSTLGRTVRTNYLHANDSRNRGKNSLRNLDNKVSSITLDCDTTRNSRFSATYTQEAGYMPSENVPHRPENTRREVQASSTMTRNSQGSAKAMTFQGWKEPLLLIQSHKNCNYTVIKETERELRKITEDMAIISIVGPYRTGKSFLMNVIADRKGTKWDANGFTVGNKVSAETKGIWILCLPHPKKKNTVLALLDSEGFGDIKQGISEHESNILLLNLLLSSTLLYNSVGVLNAEAVDKLQNVAKMASKVKVDEDSSKDLYTSDNALAMIFPHFIWVLRDFVLDREGKTPDEYLEDALERKPGSSEEDAIYNATRDCMSRYFAKRNCLVLPPLHYPHANGELRKFKEIILTSTNRKHIDAQSINGNVLVNLAKCYTHAISTKTTIYVFNEMGIASCEHFKGVYKEAIDLFEQRLLNTGNFENARYEAGLHLVENKCYDFRFYNQLMMYTKDRQNGKAPFYAHTFSDISPNGVDDHMHWQTFLEIAKGEKMPISYMESIIDSLKKRVDEWRKINGQQMDHHKKEYEVAKKSTREYRAKHIHDYSVKFEKARNDRINREKSTIEFMEKDTFV